MFISCCKFISSFCIISLFKFICYCSQRGKIAEKSFWGQEKSQYLINKKIISLSALDSFLKNKPLASHESRESRPSRVGGPPNISASTMWTEIIIVKGPGSEKFQPKITMRMDIQNCWLTSIMIETNSSVKPSNHVLRDLLDELAREKVLLGSSVSQLKARYLPTASGKNSSQKTLREKRIYRNNSDVLSQSGNAKSAGSHISAEEAFEKYRDEMEQLKQMQLEAKSADSQTSNI